MKFAILGLWLGSLLLFGTLVADKHPAEDPTDEPAAREVPPVSNASARPSAEVFVAPLDSLVGAEKERRAAEGRIRAALRQRVDVKFNDVPLNEAMEALERKVDGVQILLDVPSLLKEGIALIEPVTLTCEGATLGQVLFRMLNPLGLTWLVRDESLLITTLTRSDETLSSRVWNVARHVRELEKAHKARAEARKVDAENSLDDSTRLATFPPQTLDGIVHDCVGEWDFGGKGIHLAGTVLSGRSNDRSHDETEWFLRALIDFLDGKLAHGAAQYRPDWSPAPDDMRIRSALRERIAPADLKKATVFDVAAFLRERLQIRVIVDETALKEEGIDPTEAIGFSARDITVESALRRNFQPRGLASYIRHGILIIGTEIKADDTLVYTLYDLRDLLDNGLDENQIVDAILTCTSGPWEEVDWMAGIRDLPFRGAFLVHQTPSMHEEIAILLSDMRAALAAAPRDAGAPPEKPRVDTDAVETTFYPLGSSELVAELTRSIPMMVAPESWRSAGGQGVISTAGRTIAVRQTRSVHAEIRRFLRDHRAAESNVGRPGEACTSGGTN